MTLAIHGGAPAVLDQLPHWPWFDEPAIRAVEETLRSGKVNYWTGWRGMEFERRFTAWQGSRFAISTTNGTSALHVGLTALGIGPGDEVIVQSHTFTCFAYPTYEPHHCEQIGEALKKVIRAYAR
jgi:dTDP-4-amino-4,6-dideoxygalactose transaminase